VEKCDALEVEDSGGLLKKSGCHPDWIQIGFRLDSDWIQIGFRFNLNSTAAAIHATNQMPTSAAATNRQRQPVHLHTFPTHAAVRPYGKRRALSIPERILYSMMKGQRFGAHLLHCPMMCFEEPVPVHEYEIESLAPSPKCKLQTLFAAHVRELTAIRR
jgi:hypothetical protein